MNVQIEDILRKKIALQNFLDITIVYCNLFFPLLLNSFAFFLFFPTDLNGAEGLKRGGKRIGMRATYIVLLKWRTPFLHTNKNDTYLGTLIFLLR